VAVVAAWLPESPLGRLFGFVPLPWAWWPVLAATTACYLVLTFAAKRALVRRGWIE
jgi:Mg2+-importing ATPase